MLHSQLSALLANDGSLLEGYKNAYEAVNFEGDAKEHAKVKAWELENKSRFKDDGFILAIRLHVQYLMTTMIKKAGEDEEAIKQIKNWVEAFPRTAEKFRLVGKQQILTGGVAGSVFMKAGPQAFNPKGGGMNVRVLPQMDMLQGFDSWYLGDLTRYPDVYRVNVIGHLRVKQDARIFDEWKTVIRYEQEAAERDGLAARRENFIQQRRPWLLWQVGRDYVLFRQFRQGVDLMVQALRESPRCQDYEKIVADIRNAIAEALRAQANPPAASSAGSPAPAH